MKLFIPAFIFIINAGITICSAEIIFNRDTVERTLDQEEKLFIEQNFSLLAARYELSAADAEVIQARLYRNPSLYIDQGAYNHVNRKWFDASRNGETAASLQQLIVLGGKRKKQIDLAGINSKITSYRFYELIRNLTYELRTSFYNLYYVQQSIGIYDNEISQLKSVIDAYTAQYNKGNISFRDLSRLQSLLFTLDNERIDLLNEAADAQSNLAIITGDTTGHAVKPVTDKGFMSRIDNLHIDLQELRQSGMESRYDYQIAKSENELSEKNLALQKAFRVPDLTLGANWDRQGSYITNYNSLSVSIDLPVINRNQGNIRIAADKLEESKLMLKQTEVQIDNEIIKAYTSFIQADNLYKSSNTTFNTDYQRMLDGITKAFREHSISLLEFLDYYETYKETLTSFNKLQNNRMNALEELNLVTGQQLIQ